MTTETPVLSSADGVLRQIEAASEKQFLPIVGPHKGKILAEEVRKAKPRHVLEVGTLIGYSAILMGKELDESAEIVTIEIHRGEAETAGENILKANIPAKVKIITGNAIEVIPTLGVLLISLSLTLTKPSTSNIWSWRKISCGRARLLWRTTLESSLTKCVTT
jgi:predicted O-methyltransferase YrrM